LINRKISEKGEKDGNLGSLKGEGYQKRFLEFLRFKEITEKKNLRSLSDEEEKKFLEFLEFQGLFENLKVKYKVSTLDLIKKLEQDILIPASIFTRRLGILETICKYLKENLNFSNKKIASLIGRSSKSVWQAYNESKKKLEKKFEILPTRYFIPVSILQNKELSVLENIVVYLKEEFSLRYHEIAVLLKRDDRTIWSVYQKARKKNVK